MRLINLRCSNCGAELQIDADRQQAFCTYCGTKLLLDEENIQVTNRYIDEARLKEAEVRLKELEYMHEREIREELLRKEQKRSQTAAVVFAAVGLFIAYQMVDRSMFMLLLIFSLIALSNMRSDDRRGLRGSDEYYSSPKNKWTALILCFFFGIFGVHYFYVGRVGKGLLYLFTVGLFGIGWFIDMIRILCGTFRDRDSLYLR